MDSAITCISIVTCLLYVQSKQSVIKLCSAEETSMTTDIMTTDIMTTNIMTTDITTETNGQQGILLI